MKDADDWEFVLNTVDALFYRMALGVGARADISLADCHEGLWTAFEKGQFKLKPGDGDDDDSIGVVSCEADNDRRAAMKQNKPLAKLPAAGHRGCSRGGLGALVAYEEEVKTCPAKI